MKPDGCGAAAADDVTDGSVVAKPNESAAAGAANNDATYTHTHNDVTLGIQMCDATDPDL